MLSFLRTCPLRWFAVGRNPIPVWTATSVLSVSYLAKLGRIHFHQQGGEGRRYGGVVDRQQHSLMEI